ncbi:MAG: transposase [Kiritimatiellales bacterium]|nr:transposase [Kiritimatiellales bacterium]
MGRTPRIEFEGAVYHVMSRGNRQESIFRDKQDCEMFLKTLAEACERCGWRVHAYVLMGNHYHLLLETPEANLVDGMRWLQGTYTKRFNLRYAIQGHLLQGRYKALLVDADGDYFQTVGSYIHLNPARAKCFDLKAGKLADYRWSSYPLYIRPAKRPDWLCVDRTLGALGLSDEASGRARYRQYMQKRVLEIADSKTPREADANWNKIRRGWYFGSDEFRDRMVQALDGVFEGKRRDSFVGDEARKHDVLEADRLFKKGLKAFNLSASQLADLRKNDPRKKVLAWLIRKNTSVKNAWIAERVQMGCVSNMSQYVGEVERAKAGKIHELRKMLK